MLYIVYARLRGWREGSTKQAHQEDARFTICVSHPIKNKQERGCGETHTPNNKITILARALKILHEKSRIFEMRRISFLHRPFANHHASMPSFWAYSCVPPSSTSQDLLDPATEDVLHRVSCESILRLCKNPKNSSYILCQRRAPCSTLCLNICLCINEHLHHV